MRDSPRSMTLVAIAQRRADRICLEPAMRVGDAVVHQRIQQRMPQPRQRRARVVPRDSPPFPGRRRDAARGPPRRSRRRSRRVAAAQEAIGDTARSCVADARCKRIDRARIACFAPETRVRAPGARRNFVYNCPSNAAFSHRRRIARPRARRDSRRHPRRASRSTSTRSPATCAAARAATAAAAAWRSSRIAPRSSPASAPARRSAGRSR